MYQKTNNVYIHGLLQIICDPSMYQKTNNLRSIHVSKCCLAGLQHNLNCYQIDVGDNFLLVYTQLQQLVITVFQYTLFLIELYSRCTVFTQPIPIHIYAPTALERCTATAICVAQNIYFAN